ncbi:hypothetical protein AVEN_199575-1 [Araneus ventricosus]|uniref:Uncharacterized protein n=1 Tax=Araneus ventricosus TaxID=182803 RepID=A0A4Y2P2P2_ARAVE|nr:hypothetical protein AVEN_16640-1 [Araneus ventricosus]GBN50166.1 hypothetical protein AVEN_199575-1 [Araneus ventricosus]
MATRKEDSCTGNHPSERKSVKILILGDFGIGKTTLVTTYLGLGCIPEDEENVFEEYRVKIIYNGNEVDVGLYDLSPGPTAFERRECYPTDVNTILLCFSIGHYESLKSVYNLWIHEVRAHYGKLIPIFLVGLRRDLRLLNLSIDPFLTHSEFRVVEKSEAEDIHKNYRFHGDYMECSMYGRSCVVNVINQAVFAAMEA